MSISTIDSGCARAQSLAITDDTLSVELVDGRTIAVPLAWFPRLLHGTPAERANWRLLGNNEGAHWPDLDEDISIISLLAGHRSAESPASLDRWLKSRS